MAEPPPDHFADARVRARAAAFDAWRQARLETLIMALAARGLEPDDPRLPAYLAPLFDAPPMGGVIVGVRGGQTGSAEPPQEPPTSPGPELPRWRAAALATAIMAVAVALFWPWPAKFFPDGPTDSLDPTPTPTSVPGPDQPPDLALLYLLNALSALAILALAVLTVLLVLAAPRLRRWWEQRRRRQLRRDPLPDPTPLAAVASRLARARLFDQPELADALRALRRHRAVPSHLIDIRRSIRATIRNGAIPTIRFARRRLSPDYVLLSERERPHDHLAQFAGAWRERLANARIPCAHYEFFGDPHTLRHVADTAGHGTGPGSRATSFDSVLYRHEGGDCVVMLESFDALPSFERIPAWPGRIGGRVRASLMNPRAPQFWSPLELRLDRLGLPSFAASTEGTLAFAAGIDRVIDADRREAAVMRAPSQPDLAAFLAEHRLMVLSLDAPSEAQVETIVDTLERWLDADAFDWLRALALYPMVDTGFTMFAGLALKDAPIVTHDRFLTLARLPWLRAATMPDWLRLALVETLTPEALARAAATASAFLQPPDSLAERIERLVELRREAEDPARRKALAKRLERGATPVFSDRLLIEALKGVPPDKLAVAIDRDLAQDSAGKRRFDRNLVIFLGQVCLIGLLGLQPMAWQRSGFIPVGEAEPEVGNEPPPQPNAPAATASPTATPVDPPEPAPTDDSTVTIPQDQPSEATSAALVPTPPVQERPCEPATGKENSGPFIVFFDWDRSDITPPSISLLDAVINNFTCGAMIDVVGFTDAEKSAAYSIRLSQRRADSVAAYLISQGIPASAIRTEGRGKTQPRIPTADGVRESQNRRVEITLIPGELAQNTPAG